jgi:hypothetical protein
MSPLVLVLAVSFAAADASIDPSDGGWPDPSADFEFLDTRSDLGLLTVWTDDRRGARWGTPRGGDLWINTLSADGGVRLRPRYGSVLCRGVDGETLSTARISMGPGGAVVAWRVTRDGGQAVRASLLRFLPDGGAQFDSCANELSPLAAGVRSIQLDRSGSDTLITWEDEAAVRAQFFGGTGGPLALAQKTGPEELNWPSVAAVDTGFVVAWSAQGTMRGAGVSVRADGGAFSLQPGARFFTAEALAGPAVVASAPLTAVWASPSVPGTPLGLKSGRGLGGGLAEQLLGSVPELVPGPLVATVTQGPLGLVDTTWVGHLGGDGGAALTRFRPMQDQTFGLTVPGAEPQAVTTVGGEPRLLVSKDGFLAIAALVGNGAATAQVPLIERNDALPDQVAPSAAWAGQGWLVAWNEPSTVRAVGLALDGTFVDFDAGVLDAGLARVVPVADTTQLAAAYEGSPVSAVLELGRGLTTSDLAAGQFSAAVKGSATALMWRPGGNLISKVGALPVTVPGVLGRCGAWADGYLLVPFSHSNGGLWFVVLGDDASAPVELKGPVVANARLSSACVAADRDRLLLAAVSGDGTLAAFETKVSDVVSPRLVDPVPGLPARPGALSVIDPVVARTPAGWQLAWYSMMPKGGAIRELHFEREAMPAFTEVTSGDADDREPQLIASTAGPVLLLWRRFEPATGSLALKWRVLPLQLPTRDAGVAPVDAGVDAGVEADGGVDAGADGGMGETADAGTGPVVFSTCSCDAGPALLSVLAVAVLARRRRSAR